MPTQTDNGIQVWWVDLDYSPSEEMISWLSDAEMTRANTFQFDKHRRRFLASRIAFHTIIGQHLGIPPHEVIISQQCGRCGGQHGKPVLVNSQASTKVSLSRAGNIALVGISDKRDIGVDVEIAWPAMDWAAIGNDVLSPSDLSALKAQNEEREIQQLGTRLWVYRESLGKMLGYGLAPLPDGIPTLTHNGSLPKVVHLSNTMICEISTPQYIAAIAIATTDIETVPPIIQHTFQH